MPSGSGKVRRPAYVLSGTVQQSALGQTAGAPVGGLKCKKRILKMNKQAHMEGELYVTEPKTKNSVRKVALSQQTVDLLVQEHEQLNKL